MANKRQLKKRVRYICGDLAADIILASYVDEHVTTEVSHNILNKIASLQEETISKATFCFDKVVKDFPNRAKYQQARTVYNKKAFAQLRKEFTEKAQAIVKEMNDVVPADVRKIVAE